MKTGLSMYSLVQLYRGKASTAEFLYQAKEWNLKGVELLDSFWQDLDKELDEVVALKNELGIEIYSYSIDNNFVNSDPRIRLEQVEKVAQAVEVAIKLGSKVIRVFSGGAPQGEEIAFDEALAWILEGLKAGVEIAEKAGITLALENHGLFAGKSQQLRQVIDTVNSDALGLTLDTGNFLLVDENPVESVRKLADKAALIHFKDFKSVGSEVTERVCKSLDGKRYQGTIIGQGDVDLSTIVSLLNQHRYGGYLSIEFVGPGDPISSVEASIKFVNGTIASIKGV